MPRITLPNNWRPRPYQRRAWAALQQHRMVSLWWHRRAGKDDVALHHTACAAMERAGNYWHMLPEANQARTAIWNAVNPATGKRRIDEAFPPEICKRRREDTMYIELANGSSWQLVGSDNFRSLVGSPPIGIVYSEFAKADPLAYAYLSPILAENNGWQLFITTPEGQNHAYSLHEALRTSASGYAETLTVDSTGVYTPERLLEEKERLLLLYGEAYGHALFRQEYYCSAEAAIIGTIYGHEISEMRDEGRITSVQAAAAKVHTAWDIGRTDATAIWWFQHVGNEVRVLDYYEASLEDLGHYSEQIRGRRIETDLAAWAYGRQPIVWGGEINGLEHRRCYDYGTHYLPHDAAHKTLAASGKSTLDILRKSLGNVTLVRESQAGLDDASRSAVIALLRRAWVDTRAARGIQILSEYKYRYDEARRIMSREPVHNYASHCADAARVMALSIRYHDGIIKARERHDSDSFSSTSNLGWMS